MVGTLAPSLFELRRDKSALPALRASALQADLLAVQAQILCRSATNWHDGQITQNLSSPSRKNIPLNAQAKSAA